MLLPKPLDLQLRVLRTILNAVLSMFRLTVPAAFANVAGLAEGLSDFDATLPV